jgi:Tfp pilus assembly protein PilF
MGTGGTGTGQTGSFVELMRAGYAATQQRDYTTALTYFQQALQLRPNNPYARRAVSNVQSYMQRDAQRGTTTTPTNQSGR